MKPHFVNRDRLSPARQRLFAFVSMLLPLLAFVAIELLLRLFGYGGYEPVLMEVADTPQGRMVITSPEGKRGFFFANPDRIGSSNRHVFYTPKDANTVRIVLVGGSAINGYPQSRLFASSSFLEEMLGDVWPERTIEIINLGTTAVASFPARKFLEQALEYEPDLVIVYSGHNEFYGAYGVASSSQAGSTPAMLVLQYRVRGLAIVQGLGRLISLVRGEQSGSLMEVMMGQDYIAADSWKREAAAQLLYEHTASMIRMSREKEVPVLVCSLPSNERDLAPIGADTGDSEVDSAVAKARTRYRIEPEKVIDELTGLLERWPYHSRLHFYLGKAWFAAGDPARARQHFVQARDLDPMPWRATTQSQQGIRRAVEEQGAQLCDAESAFRGQSPGGSIGWELMDDHVHLSLQGQSLLARTIVETLTSRDDSLRVSPQQLASLPGWQVYADRLGDNPYDRYAVAYTLRNLFAIPFMRSSNPEAMHRFDWIARNLFKSMTPSIRKYAMQWHRKETHAKGRQPISGLVARGLLRENRLEEAMALYTVAMHSAPAFTTRHFEYVYFMLAIRRWLYGELSPEDIELASREIARGKLLVRHGYTGAGMVESYIGRLHQLRDDHIDSIPWLLAARQKLDDADRIENDRALVLSYVRNGDLERARDVVRTGVQQGGQYADHYSSMLAAIPGVQ